MAKFTYDVVIIGSGASGTTVAFEAQAAGLKVAIVEERNWVERVYQRMRP